MNARCWKKKMLFTRKWTQLEIIISFSLGETMKGFIQLITWTSLPTLFPVLSHPTVHCKIKVRNAINVLNTSLHTRPPESRGVLFAMEMSPASLGLFQDLKSRSCGNRPRMEVTVNEGPGRMICGDPLIIYRKTNMNM